MEHERMRFNKMTMPQLYTRLGRITKVDKLERFIRVAGERGMDSLKTTAERRLAILTGRPTEPRKQFVSVVAPQRKVVDVTAEKVADMVIEAQKEVERKLKEEPKLEILPRHLDF